jgi:hypothetical protein
MILPTQVKLVHMNMHAWVNAPILPRFNTHKSNRGCNAAGDIYRDTHYPIVYKSLEFAPVAKMMLHIGGMKPGVILCNLVTTRLDKFSFM